MPTRRIIRSRSKSSALPVERMAELCREIAQRIDAMSPEERAEYLTKETFRQQKADEDHFAGKSREERLEILSERDSFRDSIRGKWPILISSSSESPFPWLERAPDGQSGRRQHLSKT